MTEFKATMRQVMFQATRNGNIQLKPGTTQMGISGASSAGNSARIIPTSRAANCRLIQPKVYSRIHAQLFWTLSAISIAIALVVWMFVPIQA